MPLLAASSRDYDVWYWALITTHSKVPRWAEGVVAISDSRVEGSIMALVNAITCFYCNEGERAGGRERVKTGWAYSSKKAKGTREDSSRRTQREGTKQDLNTSGEWAVRSWREKTEGERRGDREKKVTTIGYEREIWKAREYKARSWQRNSTHFV